MCQCVWLNELDLLWSVWSKRELWFLPRDSCLWRTHAAGPFCRTECPRPPRPYSDWSAPALVPLPPSAHRWERPRRSRARTAAIPSTMRCWRPDCTAVRAKPRQKKSTESPCGAPKRAVSSERKRETELRLLKPLDSASASRFPRWRHAPCSLFGIRSSAWLTPVTCPAWPRPPNLRHPI